MSDGSSHSNLNTECYLALKYNIEFQLESNRELDDKQKDQLQKLFSSQIQNISIEQSTQMLSSNEYYTIFNIGYSGQILAGAVFRINSLENIMEIKMLAVSDQVQGCGIGAKIMQELKDVGQRQFNVLKLTAEVDSFRVGYYLKQGFKLIKDNQDQCQVEYIFDTQQQQIIQPDDSLLNQIEALHSTEPIYHYLITHNERKPCEISQIHSNSWQIDQFETCKEMCKQRFYKDCTKIIINMKKQISCRPFLKPVDFNKVLDYKDKVQQPMDIETIENNLLLFKYQKKDDFINDVKLIFRNCYAYNKPDSQYYKLAKLLEKYTQPMLNMLRMHEPTINTKKVCKR